MTSALNIKASPQTYQLRVTATTTTGAWFATFDSSTTLASTASSVWINAGAAGEYFSVVPGSWYGCVGNVNVTEMT
jgi:hypothetical protein